TELALGRSLLAVGTRTSGTPGFHGVTGGVYKARERIHRGVADPRLLAIPASCGRVAARNPNLGQVSGIRSTLRSRSPLSWPWWDVCSPGRKGHDDLTSSPPSSGLTPAVPRESSALPVSNTGQGLRSLRDLTQHLTTRADDSHAAPVHVLRRGLPVSREFHVHVKPR